MVELRSVNSRHEIFALPKTDKHFARLLYNFKTIYLKLLEHHSAAPRE